MAQVNLKNVAFKILGGSGGEIVIVTVGEGNITWSEKKNIDYKLDKGVLNAARLGDQATVEVSFDIRWDFVRGPGATTPTPYDALTQSGDASSWTSTANDPCEPYAVDLQVVHTPPCTTGDALDDQETITFQQFRVETIDFDFSSGTISCTGKCNIETPSVLRI